MATAYFGDQEYLAAGYPKLGQRMGLIPEQAIFRRFSALGAESLLYQQAELVDLEKELRKIQQADHEDGDELRRKYAVNWLWLHESNTEGDNKQWELFLKIRAKLGDYYEGLILQSKVASLSEPGNYDLKDIQNFLASSDMGPLALIGADKTIWGSVSNRKDHSPDLMALLPRHNQDIFSKWITEKAVVQFFKCGLHRLGKTNAIPGLPSFNDGSLLGFTYFITSVVASLLPIASISILYFVRSMQARLAIIAIFNLIVALSLTAFTTAKRSEVFAVVAA
ncbi:MAG: hypothetical protein Q9165_003200 [Trypethelium subeluteriae]